MARSTTGIAYAFLYVVILSGLIFTVFVTIPAWSAWQATRQVLAERVLAHGERVRFLANVGARVQELRTYAADARVLSVGFPEYEAPADALGVLGALAARSGLTIRVVHGPELRKDTSATTGSTASQSADDLTNETRPVSSRPSASRGAVYAIKVQVRGTYTGLNAFLRDLEKSVRFFDIPALDVKGGFEGGLVEVDITLHTYIAETGGTLLPAGSETSGSSVTPSPVP